MAAGDSSRWTVKALLSDSERSELLRRLSEANQYNRFLKRQVLVEKMGLPGGNNGLSLDLSDTLGNKYILFAPYLGSIFFLHGKTNEMGKRQQRFHVNTSGFAFNSCML
ncbi:unnamed protein product [Miscanthus lutarioriparius]|uniref:Uncharacterized protein n=1 Tax=Miscanthus lutarioriparius TaxID=422564 RepID=A0A811QMI7_9POAL|nr:unnamed protein product [Miscanthus lutarioriparius]